MTLEQAGDLAKSMLSEKRYHHTQNVAQAAKTLALRYGADPAKAELAGLLHDIVKEQSKEQLLQLMEQDDIIAQSTKDRPLPVWHGPCAAIYAKHKLGVTDPEVLSAIDCHTTGKADMTKLDKILFLADVISAERSFPGVGAIRQLAKKDLDAAVIAAMEENILYLKNKGKPLDRDTVEALDALRRAHKRKPT